jgi:hypothetical protein
MPGVTGETTTFEQTDQVFGAFGEQVGPVLDSADQMVAGLQSRGVDADTIGDATHISELAAQLNAACVQAQENHRNRHGGLNEAHHTAPVRAAEREYYEGG